MKLYNTRNGPIIKSNRSFYNCGNADWDVFVNDDDLFRKMTRIVQENVRARNGSETLDSVLKSPIQSQELWGAGVTYFRSKEGREEESKDAGGGKFYLHVYEAERPEIFLKATPHRVVGPHEKVRIRRDSTWNCPEPELTLMITSNGKIVGYTIGNDMSSRSIEGENPLYLPQAKTYDKCAALGPCIYVTESPLPKNTVIEMKILRAGKLVFEGRTRVGQIKRTFDELVDYLYRECSFPHGSLLMTGTGIVPPSDFTLQSGDRIKITIDPIGTLENSVE